MVRKGEDDMVDKGLSCSWCSRSQDETKHLLAGPSVAVCDECLGLLTGILAEKHSEWRDAQIERLVAISRHSDQA
jgi:ATP-dependent Clp protease ATP-binding subunit ClpX